MSQNVLMLQKIKNLDEERTSLKKQLEESNENIKAQEKSGDSKYYVSRILNTGQKMLRKFIQDIRIYTKMCGSSSNKLYVKKIL